MTVNKQHELSAAGKPIDRDAAFRRTIQGQLLERIEERQDLPGPSIPIGRSTFHSLAQLVSWPRGARELVDSVIYAINSESVLYLDKFDYLAFLAELVRRGPAGQARRIAKHALEWLTGEIKGRSVGPNVGGPLSNVQFSVGGLDELRSALLYLIDQCALRCPEVVLESLLEWLPLNASSLLPDFAYHLLRISLSLIGAAANKSDQSAAILVGVADSIALLSIGAKANEVVRAFDDIVLRDSADQYATAESQATSWNQTMFRQWRQRLVFLARNASPQVRESVAKAVTRWICSDLPTTNDLIEVRDRLAEDCRLRVRNAIVGGEGCDLSDPSFYAAI